jgi:glycosyltransferase involved in cell wall biosynthesis
VVAAAVGGMLDTVVPGITGEHVPPRDPGALAAALRELLDDPERRAAYGVAGRNRAVELYDWTTIVDSTEAAYESVVTARSRTTTEVAR